MVKLTDQQISDLMDDLGARAKAASLQLANAPTDQKNAALRYAAEALRKNQQDILDENAKDMAAVNDRPDYKASYKDRLLLTQERIEDMAIGLEEIATLDDPVGEIIAKLNPRNPELTIQRIRVPLGVIGIIYESRPNVTADAGALSLKSGNTCILRGGSDSINSSKIIAACLHEGLEKANLPANCIQMIPTSDRRAVGALLKSIKFVDVIVPRGGRNLIERVQNESKVPVFSHLEGLNHIFLDKIFDRNKAMNVILNSKMRRTGVCGSLETLLIHRDVSHAEGSNIIKYLLDNKCEIRGDDTIQSMDERVTLATEADWKKEYLAPILSVRMVDDLNEAMAHIATYGSGHTDCIITENVENAGRFLREVDSAIVIHNASTQFADGGEFGMGAEIGISTGRMHARGPVGVEQLTTFKYSVVGSGTIRA